MVAFAGYPLLVEGRVVGVVAMFARKALTEGVLTDLAPLAEGIAQFIDRRQADERFRRQAELHRVTLASIGDAVLTTDDQGRVTFLNDVAVALTGWTSEQALGQPIDAIFHIVNEDTDEAVENPVGKVLREGTIVGLANHTALIARDGTQWPIEDSAAPIKDDQGRTFGVVLVFHEVTARRDVENALRSSEERLNLAVDTAGLGLWDWDVGTGEVLWNTHHETIFGYKPGQPKRTYRDFADRILPEDLQHIEASFRHAMQERREYRFEHRVVWPEGTTRWVEAFGRFHYDANGQAKRSVGVLLDVTERKQAEQEILRLNRDLQRRVTEFQSLLEVAPVGIAVADDPECKHIWTNPAMSRLLGLPPQINVSLSATAAERPGYKVYDSGRELSPDELPLQVALATRQTVSGVKHDLLLPDGTWVSLLQYAIPLYDEQGSIRGGLYVGVDVTEQERTQKALREAEQRWRTMAEALPNLVWTDLPDGQCDWLSSQWRKYTGIPESELLGLRWLERVLHPDDRERTLACWQAACADQGDYDLEYRIRRYDGEYRWFRTRGVPLRDEQGKIIYWFGTCTDIEENKRLEAALREADRRKDEFLATLAHELRNPLAPIRNGLQVMRLSGGDGVTVDQTRTMMERQLAQMVRLVDDLMDVSRISRGKIELQKERVELAAVVHSAVETSRPLIEQMGHELTVTLPKPPVVVHADLTRLAQVFLNLLNNAAKYTERGGRIWLTAERQGSDVVVSVKDNGIGIAAHQLPLLFEMFAQLNHSLERAQGGLGIGLTLVKRLVELHDGRIEARSDGPGKGSEFLVRLPVVVEASKPHKSNKEERAAIKSSLRILVVDDNRDGADSLSMMLKMMGNDTRTAYDGEEAVAVAVEFQPDVILLDIGLPKLTGYEACRQIRNQPGGKELVIIAQTGWGQEEDRQRTHEAGFDHHMVKPVDPQALMNLLSELQEAKG
jgi:PAS domain S-box-containing protein